MTIPGGYRVGKEEIAGMIFVPIYLGLGLLFGEPLLGVATFGVLVVSVILGRLGTEWPLAIAIRTIHIIFFGLVVFMKVSTN
jgi:hypothetical protein